MKYYRHTEYRKTNYATKDYQPCWTCQNCYGGCSWSMDFEPVDGWIAIPYTLKSHDFYRDSYKIMYCPEYKSDIKKDVKK